MVSEDIMNFRQVLTGLAIVLLGALAASAQGKWPNANWPDANWPKSTPEAVGLDPAPLAALDADFRSGKYGNIDSMLVIRCGQNVFEKRYALDYDHIYGGRNWLKQPYAGPYNYFNPDWHPYYRRGELHTMQSVTKTVTSVLVGEAIRRKEFPADLDAPILRYFDAKKISNLDERKRRITLRHLLTMTSGIDWNEELPYGDPNNSSDQMEATSDWTEFVINRPMAHEPGKVFAYSSGGSQLLSHIFKQATGKDIIAYAEEHLFKQIGIKNYYWKRSPAGQADTEGGLYLAPRDLARIGYLFLQDGAWNGKPVVRPEWVQASVAPSVSEARGLKYGYLWWLIPHGDTPGHLAWAAQGFGGQRLIVAQESDLILVFTGWNIDRPSLNGREMLERLMPAVHPQSCARKF